MAARMWRAPASIVRQSGKMSFIQDNGTLASARTASSGYYLFSEVGAGVKPLVLVGDHNDIMEFLMKYKSSGVKNSIESLPDIYMAITPYRPQPRYRGLFPFHDAVKQLTDNFSRFIPGSALTDLVGAADDVVKSLKPKGYASIQSSKTSLAQTNMMAITWSYLDFTGSQKIGSGTVDFSAMYAFIDNKLGSIYGI